MKKYRSKKGVDKMIVNKFSEILGKRKMKISDVHDATGISRPTLTALYYDKSKGIKFDTLDKLCRYLRIQPGDILERKGD